MTGRGGAVSLALGLAGADCLAAASASATGKSTRRAIGQALGQVVRSTAGRLRPGRGARSAVLAPPEEEEEEDTAAAGSAGALVVAAAGGSGSSLSDRASLSPSRSAANSSHLRGYATVPHGFTPAASSRPRSVAELAQASTDDEARPVTQPALRDEKTAASAPAREHSGGDATVVDSGDSSSAGAKLHTPLRAEKASGGLGVALASLTPVALFSRAVSSFSLRHRGGAPSHITEAANSLVAASDSSSIPPTATAPASSATAGRGAGRPLIVPMGGDFADTEPTFVQVDGEGYKVFALRRLELSFCARALMVTFK
jgi:hypothetical protein